jgi:hypothetical protein
MEIPETYLQQVSRYLKAHPVFLAGRFTYDDVYFQVRVVKISSLNNQFSGVFYLSVSFQRIARRIIQFSCRPGSEQQDDITQLKELFKRFNDWKKFLQEGKVQFVNDEFENVEMYKTKLFFSEWTSGEANDVCYICHEPCLYYETRNCVHPIHKLCFVKMIQKGQVRCGICKKSFCDEDDEEDYD